MGPDLWASRTESAKGTSRVLEELRKLGVHELVMLTGDNSGTAKAIAEAIGLENHQAELLPAEEVSAVANLRERFDSVAMIGDGVNDARALAAATTGIAMGAAGTDAAIEAALGPATLWMAIAADMAASLLVVANG